VAVASAGRKGLGVFATSAIEAGEIVEVCQVIVEAERNIADGANLDRYVYAWGEPDEGVCAVALGYGSIFNHSFDPNAVFATDVLRGTITFRARRRIGDGEEITINYNGDPACTDPVDFGVAE
jgi:hypothetical protein